jgi:hypothetical protein
MKKKMWNRIVSAFLAIMMVFTVLPLNIVAAENDDEAAQMNISLPDSFTDSGEEMTVFSDAQTNVLKYDNTWNGVDVASSLDGEGTEDSPFTISTGAELMYFVAQVNAGNTYERNHIHLKANIDMDMFTNSQTWTPIGVLASAPFKGTFDGGCHEIANLNITYDSQKVADDVAHYVGFFGYVSGAQICDFGIYNYKLEQTYNCDTEIGALVAESGVAFAWDKYITEETTRESLVEDWKTSVSSPVCAASSGEIDDIISVNEMRARICSALLMLAAKGDVSLVARRKVLPL